MLLGPVGALPTVSGCSTPLTLPLRALAPMARLRAGSAAVVYPLAPVVRGEMDMKSAPDCYSS